ncbi:GAF domain-containing protein [Streptomyces sp. NPDC056333]|uniref:GAF domain-containing protein n=1 Tax=Streptomyces sp. NPDC056333 TaxID=3345786 RepID=UPI0035DE9082
MTRPKGSPDDNLHPEAPGRTRHPSGTHSALVVPLTLRGGVMGTLSLYHSPGRAVFDQEDLDLALELASRTALHIDNARRYTREHTIALTLHRQLLPQRPLRRTAVEASHFHQPMEAGAAAGSTSLRCLEPAWHLRSAEFPGPASTRPRPWNR